MASDGGAPLMPASTDLGTGSQSSVTAACSRYFFNVASSGRSVLATVGAMNVLEIVSAAPTKKRLIDVMATALSTLYPVARLRRWLNEELAKPAAELGEGTVTITEERSLKVLFSIPNDLIFGHLLTNVANDRLANCFA
jgi:hypothetical protein